MPAISASAQNLIRDAKLTTADVDTLRSAVSSGQATVQDVVTIASKMVDALDSGVGSAIQKLLRDIGGRADLPAPLANLGAAPGLLNGTTVFPRDAATKKNELILGQRALIALASRTADPELMLPKFGADGGWGAETEMAVRAFQKKSGIAETGMLDMDTAQKLDTALKNTRVPPIFAGGVDPNQLDTKNVANAAKNLVTKRPDAYGVDDAWVNCDPRHALPANVPLGGLKGQWKCNLFACNSLVAGGFEPPYQFNGGRGEYPLANMLWMWSDKYAAQHRNGSHVRFEMRGELRPETITDPAALEQAVKDLLKNVEVGDLVIVDHQGGRVGEPDGGHCRVCVGKNSDGSFEFAQASSSQAEIQTENHRDVMNEEHIWILRPNKRRPEGPAPVN